MSSQDIREKVIEIAAKQGGVEPAQVTPEHHFENDLHFDSLDKVEFAMTLEDEFNTKVPDEAAETFQTVGQVIDYVEEQRMKDEG